MAWDLTGNGGTDPAVNFLGTTDNKPLVIKSNGTERLRVDPSGNVGIGATTPAALLEINRGSAGGAALRLSSAVSGWGARLDLNDASAGGKNYYVASRRGSFWIGGKDDTENHLTIDSGGNVGIGTTTPAAPLEINRGSAGGAALRLSGAGAGWGACLELIDTSGGGRYWVASRAGSFRIGGKGDHLTIDSGGNVGIGTTTPAAALEINRGSVGGFALRLSSAVSGWGAGLELIDASAGGKRYVVSSQAGSFQIGSDKGNLLTIDT